MIGTLSDIRTKTREVTLTERSPQQPFRIALVGDFSGRASRGEAPRSGRLSGVTPLLVDSQNCKEVMERLEVRLELARGSTPLVFQFRQLEDFHPDKLAQTEIFQAILKRCEGHAPTVGQPGASGGGPGTPPEIGPDTSARAAESDEEIRRLISAEALGGRAKGEAGNIAAELMGAVLGHPRFQALESAWRSVTFLLQRLETGSDLRIELIDLTSQELVADTLASDDLSSSGLYRMLVEEAVGTPGQAAWSALVPLEIFTPKETDLRVMDRLAGIARIAGAPLLAGADPAFAGCESIGAEPDPENWKRPLENSARRMWDELRRHWAAPWIGLAMPRFLLRLPYGGETSAITSFPFEEMPDPPMHDAYLWGSPAVACVCLLGCAYNRYGWNFRPGKISRLEGIAVHTFKRAGLAVTAPAAEVWLTEEGAERILDHGIMPLMPVKNSDAIELQRFQSIAMPPRPLAGPWD